MGEHYFTGRHNLYDLKTIQGLELYHYIDQNGYTHSFTVPNDNLSHTH